MRLRSSQPRRSISRACSMVSPIFTGELYIDVV
jgi:hypothetical protein